MPVVNFGLLTDKILTREFERLWAVTGSGSPQGGVSRTPRHDSRSASHPGVVGDAPRRVVPSRPCDGWG